MSKRRKKLTRKQCDVMQKRAQRFVNLTYFYRRGSWFEEIDRHGFLAPVPLDKRQETLRMANLAPQHWEIACIAYFKDRWGKEYRQTAGTRTTQRLAAWVPERDNDGEILRDDDGSVRYRDQLTPLIEPTLAAAEEGGNPRQLIDRAVVIRPWSPQWPSIMPVLRQVASDLDLAPNELEELGEEFAA